MLKLYSIASICCRFVVQLTRYRAVKRLFPADGIWTGRIDGVASEAATVTALLLFQPLPVAVRPADQCVKLPAQVR